MSAEKVGESQTLVNKYAGVAQLVEQLICNQQVGGSSPSTSSTVHCINMGEFPSGQREQTVNLSVVTFGGSNPPSPTKLQDIRKGILFRFVLAQTGVNKGDFNTFSLRDNLPKSRLKPV